MRQVIFYQKNNCTLCDEASALLEVFQMEYEFSVEKRDIDTNDEWLLAYLIQIPVVEIAGEQLNCEQIDYTSLDCFFRKHFG
ncbi:glutaredoxin family protein [Ornithinibacillus sp. 4-3]|uniref:Glutaredoxin family protein n=1 Tax=Ornithinibacillus sp. 4-3 TaxID=3231488 RepID=A0AB39HQ21_9BACI